MGKSDRITSGVCLGLGLFIVFYSPIFEVGSLKNPGSGFMPFLSGIIICTFSLITLLRASRIKEKKIEPLGNKIKLSPLMMAIGALIFFPLLIKWAGFMVSSFLLILVTMRYAGAQTWKATILWAGLGSLSSYLLFETLLKSQLPKGILGF